MNSLSFYNIKEHDKTTYDAYRISKGERKKKVFQKAHKGADVYVVEYLCGDASAACTYQLHFTSTNWNTARGQLKPRLQSWQDVLIELHANIPDG